MNPVLDRRSVAFDMQDVRLGYCRERRVGNLPQDQKEEDSSATSGTPNDVRMFPKASESSQSKSIPISNIKRTPSEVQLQEDEVMAEYRDFCMYARIVNGIHDGRRRHQRNRISAHNDALTNIIRTRNSPIIDIPSSFQEDFNRKRTDVAHDFHRSWPLPKSTESESSNRFGLAPRLEHYQQDEWAYPSMSSPIMDHSTAEFEEEGIFMLEM